MEQPHRLIARLDEAIDEALQTPLQRADASRAADEDGAGERNGAGGAAVGKGEVANTPKRRCESDDDDDDDALDEAGCAKVVQALREILEHRLMNNRCAARPPPPTTRRYCASLSHTRWFLQVHPTGAVY